MRYIIKDEAEVVLLMPVLEGNEPPDDEQEYEYSSCVPWSVYDMTEDGGLGNGHPIARFRTLERAEQFKAILENEHVRA